ncbi:hypothetical protein K1719_020545 [Acacia pycnantha]|nr:hypothetical protein K1719_020545 [Acacia pycnantha]
MAADFASFTVLFCLLCFSTLSTAVDLPAIDQTSHDLLRESNTNSDAADAIFLPSERLESESVPVAESQPEISDSKISKPDSEVETLKPMESSEVSDSLPITTISFRPINRHMPWRPMRFPARSGHRCRHNHKFKPWNPRLPRHQIPYGNDMILSNGQENNFDVLPDDRVPKIPMRWTRFGRFESDEPGMERIKEVMMRRYRYHHERDHDDEHDHHHDHDDEHDHHHERDHDEEHDHHHDHKHDHDHDDEHDHHPHHKHEHDREHDHHHERDHEEGGLMKSIRKFLQHF